MNSVRKNGIPPNVVRSIVFKRPPPETVFRPTVTGVSL